MPDEPLEVQLERAKWAGRSAFAKEILTGLAALVSAIAVVVGAWYASRIDSRVDEVKVQQAHNAERIEATGKAVDSIRASSRPMVFTPPAKE